PAHTGGTADFNLMIVASDGPLPGLVRVWKRSRTWHGERHGVRLPEHRGRHRRGGGRLRSDPGLRRHAPRARTVLLSGQYVPSSSTQPATAWRPRSSDESLMLSSRTT